MITRTTPGGGLLILRDASSSQEAPECDACSSPIPLQGGGAIVAEVGSDVVAFCPRCVLLALSVRLTAEHVKQGGTVADVTDHLDASPDPETTAQLCGKPWGADGQGRCGLLPDHEGDCLPF